MQITYNCWKKFIHYEGSFNDDLIINSSLDFQYHYNFYISSGMILKEIDDLIQNDERSISLWYYWKKIPNNIIDIYLVFITLKITLFYWPSAKTS